MSPKTHPADRQGQLIRDHWGVEVQHHVLDVSFREDDGRVRDANSGKNLAVLRRLAQTILSHNPIKSSFKSKMRKFCFNPANRSGLLLAFAKSLTPEAPK